MAWSLPWERTRDTAHKIVSEFSVCIHHTTFYQCYDNVFNQPQCFVQCFYQQASGPILQCVQSKGKQFLVTGQWPNITMCSIERKTVPSDRAMAPMLSMYKMWLHLKGDNLPLLWYLGNWSLWRKSSVLWNSSYPNPEYPETSLTLGTPR